MANAAKIPLVFVNRNPGPDKWPAQTAFVWVGGIDGTPDGLKLMADGKMAVSVFQDAIGQANGAVEVALRLARGESLDSPLIWVPFKLITPENRQEFE